jgi:hypothetical protein
MRDLMILKGGHRSADRVHDTKLREHFISNSTRLNCYDTEYYGFINREPYHIRGRCDCNLPWFLPEFNSGHDCGRREIGA